MLGEFGDDADPVRPRARPAVEEDERVASPPNPPHHGAVPARRSQLARGARDGVDLGDWIERGRLGSLGRFVHCGDSESFSAMEAPPLHGPAAASALGPAWQGFAWPFAEGLGWPATNALAWAARVHPGAIAGCRPPNGEPEVLPFRWASSSVERWGTGRPEETPWPRQPTQSRRTSSRSPSFQATGSATRWCRRASACSRQWAPASGST